MAITTEERYKQMFSQLQFASEIRLKILTAWGAVYVALAATFVWFQSSGIWKPFSWVVPLLSVGITLLFWVGDYRNRPAIGAAKDVGIAIEEDPTNNIPEKQRYFSRLNEDIGIRHGVAINIFSVIMIVLLSVATGYLLYCSACKTA